MKRTVLLELILGALIVAAFSIAGFSFYNGHRNACESRNAGLNVLQDILVLTQQTPRDRPLTVAQQRRATVFYTSAFARIDEARC